MYNSNTQIKFKNTFIKSNLYNYGDAYIPDKGIILLTNTGVAGPAAYNHNNKVIFKYCIPLTYSINGINNTQVDHA